MRKAAVQAAFRMICTTHQSTRTGNGGDGDFICNFVS
jgi:hypothetical protein